MKQIKDDHLSILSKTFLYKNRNVFSLGVLSGFKLDESAELIEEADLWDKISEALGKKGVFDMAMPKPQGEALVAGKCFAPGGEAVPAHWAAFKVGKVEKRVNVIGNRRWRKAAGLFKVPSDPEPFTEMDISWENAFGGPDDKKNPDGKGLVEIETDSGEKYTPLPNIENHKNIIKSPSDKPDPAGFAPLGLSWPSRLKNLGTFDKKWLKNDWPGYPGDFDFHYFNVAPPDQRIKGFFAGDEPIRIENMHPEKPIITSQLPSIIPRCFINRQEEDKEVFEEMEMKLDSVWLLPHMDAGVAIWRSAAEVADDEAEEISHVVAFYEQQDQEPQPLAYYKAKMDEEGEDIEMAPADEMPEVAEGKKTAMAAPALGVASVSAVEAPEAAEAPVAAGMEVPGVAEEAVPEGADELADLPDDADMSAAEAMSEEAIEEKAAAQMEKAKATLKAQGLDPGKLIPSKPEDFAGLDEKAVELMEQGIAKMAEKLKTLPPGSPAMAPAMPPFSAAALIANSQGKIDPRNHQGLFDMEKEINEDISAHNEAVAKNDPVSMDDQLKSMKNELSEMKKKLSEEEAEVTEDVEAAGKVEEAEAAAEAPPPPEAALAGGAGELDYSDKDLKDMDFKDAKLEETNFSGSDLEGVDLSGAVLEKADFTGANLSEANLSGATLTGAKFDKATLVKTNLSGVSASEASFVSADLKEADLSGSDLSNADFTAADLTGATIKNADFSKAKMQNSLCQNLQGEGVILAKTDLSELDFSHSQLNKADFTGATLNETNFSQAALQDAQFDEARGNGAVFIEADMQKSRTGANTYFASANFSQANLAGAKWDSTDCAGSQFNCADLSGASMAKCCFNKADLSLVKANKADFSKSDFTAANMTKINLFKGSLRKATLVQTDLSGSNLYGVDFYKAATEGTLLKKANLKMTLLEKA